VRRELIAQLLVLYFQLRQAGADRRQRLEVVARGDEVLLGVAEAVEAALALEVGEVAAPALSAWRARIWDCCFAANLP
jgi:hypothetical protein